ncbi:MAG: M48 family metallopeptidase [Magnetococcales bacterium]|nr:M48 family metallopeptidase [Magnetococcales bacterium]
MNAASWLIPTILVLAYLLELVANLLNLSALKQPPAPEIADLEDKDQRQRSCAYTRAKTQLEIWQSTLSLIAVLLFWFAGGFNLLDQLVRGFGWGLVATGTAYIGGLMLLMQLLGLPFDLYGTFVIEGRFGFNKTTPATFVGDWLKGWLLALVLGGPLLAVILLFFEKSGPWAWLYCWGAAGLFMVFVQYIAPTWLLPLFNRFTPLPEGELREAIIAYAKRVRFPLSNLFEVDGSRRSGKGNAFFVGFGKQKRIALFDTLIANHGVEELVAILAHEVGHYKMGHIPKGTLLSILHLGGMFYLMSLFLSESGWLMALGLEQPSVYGGLVFFSLLFTPVELIVTPAMKWMTRKFEYEADRFAARSLDDPSQLVKSLKKLSGSHLSNLTPHPFYVILHYSHPPLAQRIAALQRVIAGREQDATR